MGYIERFYWKGYFRSEEDARKNDIFDLINASITLASIEDPKEFRSRRMQIIESLFDADSQGPAKPKKRSNKIARTTPSQNQERIVIHGCKDHACKEESTVDADSRAPAKPKKRSNKIARTTPSKNQERIVIHGCKDHACKDESTDECFEEFANHLERELGEHAQPIGFYTVNEPDKKPDKISAEESFKEFANQLEKELDEDAQTTEESLEEFANQLEKELDEHAQPVGFYNVNEPDKKSEEESLDEFSNEHERELDEDAQPIGLHNVNVPDKKPNKKRKAEVSKICRSGTKFEADKKRRVVENTEKRGVQSYEFKLDASKRRFEERNRQIEKAKRRVQVRSSRMGRDGKPKQGFGSRMKKIQKSMC
ncbi:Hypothetical predicted protein [Olea europaea subsp. europaea]|uniref:Uncharacterized protein n=1 Tax=Olea europaea subsp. europaea TaxID=158383 RepID=A0A8S0SKF7_OLEEU|nr:Hypothetical predicted protein [Olea europaea subsp. europaea]